MDPEPMVFLITKSCGCWEQSIVDILSNETMSTAAVMEALRDGRTVRYVTLTEARIAVNQTCADI